MNMHIKIVWKGPKNSKENELKLGEQREIQNRKFIIEVIRIELRRHLEWIFLNHMLKIHFEITFLNPCLGYYECKCWTTIRTG